MKVRCIDTGGNTSLTVGNVYDVLSQRIRNIYEIINDFGSVQRYWVRRFEIVEEETITIMNREEEIINQIKKLECELHKIKAENSQTTMQQLSEKYLHKFFMSKYCNNTYMYVTAILSTEEVKCIVFDTSDNALDIRTEFLDIKHISDNQVDANSVLMEVNERFFGFMNDIKHLI